MSTFVGKQLKKMTQETQFKVTEETVKEKRQRN